MFVCLKDLPLSQQLNIGKAELIDSIIKIERKHKYGLKKLFTILTLPCSSCGSPYIVDYDNLHKRTSTLCKSCFSRLNGKMLPIPKRHTIMWNITDRDLYHLEAANIMFREYFKIDIKSIVIKWIERSGLLTRHACLVCPVCNEPYYRSLSDLISHAKERGTRSYLVCSQKCNGISRRSTYIRTGKSPNFVFLDQVPIGE